MLWAVSAAKLGPSSDLPRRLARMRDAAPNPVVARARARGRELRELSELNYRKSRPVVGVVCTMHLLQVLYVLCAQYNDNGSYVLRVIESNRSIHSFWVVESSRLFRAMSSFQSRTRQPTRRR